MSNFDPKSEAQVPDSVSEEAADWLLKLTDDPENQDVIDQFQSWRSQGARHEDAWARVCKAWAVLGVLQPEIPPAKAPVVTLKSPQHISAQAVVSPAALSRRPHSRRFWVVVPALAIAACLILLFAPTWLVRMQADHYTTAGSIETVALEDGTMVTLAGASAIRTRLNGDRRYVELLSGEAYFRVAHEAERRFDVQASDLSVTVHGTAFNIRRGEETTDVALSEGSISAHPVHQDDEISHLIPGQRLMLRNANGAVDVSDIDPGHIGAWRKRRLIVRNQTVASVAEQIGRYQKGWVSIPDRELAEQRVTGVYDLSDPARALRAVAAPFGGRLYKISNYINVLARSR